MYQPFKTLGRLGARLSVRRRPTPGDSAAVRYACRGRSGLLSSLERRSISARPRRKLSPAAEVRSGSWTTRKTKSWCTRPVPARSGTVNSCCGCVSSLRFHRRVLCTSLHRRSAGGRSQVPCRFSRGEGGVVIHLPAPAVRSGGSLARGACLSRIVYPGLRGGCRGVCARSVRP